MATSCAAPGSARSISTPRSAVPRQAAARSGIETGSSSAASACARPTTRAGSNVQRRPAAALRSIPMETSSASELARTGRSNAASWRASELNVEDAAADRRVASFAMVEVPAPHQVNHFDATPRSEARRFTRAALTRRTNGTIAAFAERGGIRGLETTTAICDVPKPHNPPPAVESCLFVDIEQNCQP